MGAGDVEHIAALLSPELDGQGQNASRTTAVCGVGRKLSSITFCFRSARDWDGFSATRTNFSLATSVSRAALAR